MKMRSKFSTYKRVVVKVGSSTLTGQAGENLDPAAVDALVNNLAKLKADGAEVILVSSGAIAAGLAPLKLTARPAELTLQQAAASVGQGLLMAKYTQSFQRFALTTSQVLITLDDITKSAHVQNIKAVLNSLLSLGVVPIINENDSVGTEEIKYGDNDGLAALVTNLIDADLLILITDIDGLYDANPTQVNAKRISEVTDIANLDLSTIGGAGSSGVGSGGMATKIEAARVVTKNEIPMLLLKLDQFDEAIADKDIGTFFAAN